MAVHAVRPKRSGEARESEAAAFRAFARTRDPQLRERLISERVPLATAIARRYAGARGASLEDLEQVASVALIKAVDRFDPDRGTAFSTYAVPTIQGELRRYFRDHTWAVRPPREAAETWLELLSATERLSATLGHAPTTSDLAEHLDLSVERVIAAQDARRGRWALSLDAPAHADAEDRTVGDQLGAEDEGLRRAFDRAWLHELSTLLEPLERDVMRLYFAGDLSQREIARRMGMSQMKVCRVLRRGVERLRDADQAAAA